MTAKTKQPLSAPPAHEDDALLDVRGVRLLVAMSPSHLYEQVRIGAFPAPAIREPRFTRWRSGDVRAWLRNRIAEAASANSGAAVIARARRASEAAQAKRQVSR